MGKKGIGKLASFSLGDTYTVYTKTQNDPKWITFDLSYAQMVSTANEKSYETEATLLDALPEEISTPGINSGFIVVIQNLRRNITKSTIDNLKVQLTRRFSISHSNVQITVNGDEVDLSPSELLYTHIQAVNYVGHTREDIEEMFPKARDIQEYTPQKTAGSLTPENLNELAEKKVKAWLGVVDKPNRLTELSLGGVLVYINGKIADEDLLKSNKSAQMGGRYVTGEITADYLNLQPEDPITSSRQGLDQSDGNVALLIELAEAMQNRAIQQWDAIKHEEVRKRLPERVKEDEKYVNWEKKLSPKQKQFNNKLLRLMGTFEDFENDDWMKDEEKISFLNSITTLVESLELREISHYLPESVTDQHQLLSLVTKYLGNVARQDRWQMADAAAKRLNAINQLQELVNKKKEFESAFEICLFENPWLLNPFWNRTGKSDDQLKIMRQHFASLQDTSQGRDKRGFIDIYVEVAEKELPVIVELKRHDGTGHSAPRNITKGQVSDQIDHYRKGLFSKLPLEKQRGRDFGDIPAIFIAPGNSIRADNKTVGLSLTDIESLLKDNITVKTYEQLLEEARASYQDFFLAQRGNEDLPYFRFDLDTEIQNEE
ncbi:hypothetical protein HMPREF2751_05450 [Corynebacterium sp. HMSC063G05]|nr:hypothetical protein HMPREF2751_05450 [Corynebacterium sp. HMSC063G05]